MPNANEDFCVYGIRIAVLYFIILNLNLSFFLLLELLDDDDDDDEDDGDSSDTASKNHKFIMVVGINTDKNDKITKKEFNEYLGSQSISSKVCHMLKSLEDHTPNTVNRLAKEIVEKFTNQLCPNMPEEPCLDTIDNGTPNSTPVQTPVVSIEPKWTHPVSTEEGKNNMATESHSGNLKADVGNTSDTQEPEYVKTPWLSYIFTCTCIY